ncbi:Isocitrate lyase, partial [Oxalobacteraceae bacterium IMCC9480]
MFSAPFSQSLHYLGYAMSQYQDDIKNIAGLKEKEGSAWNAINPESAARMRTQNRFKTGLDIAKY